MIRFVAVLMFAPLMAQGQGGNGNRFEDLRREQKDLLVRYATEFRQLTGSKHDAATMYNNLPLSYRTTFDAVTHALLNTALTKPDGSPMGNALQLVETIEGLHGKIAGARGDHQFRIYVVLKKDSVAKLYECREFKRTRDNTVYHIGYPVNFRQQGGEPSIQFSVTETGRRADIDVDYRSSSPTKALFDGHLTAANSDVRAGENYVSHSKRWNGFEAWWQRLGGALAEVFQGPAESTTEPFVRVEGEGNKGPAKVEDAARLFFQNWLIDRKYGSAIRAMSVKSYPCIAQYGDGSAPDSTQAQLRIRRQMEKVAVQVPRNSSIADVLQPVAMYAPGAQPVVHPQSKLFALELLPDDLAFDMDCRHRLNLELVDHTPKPPHQIRDTYGLITRFKYHAGGDGILVQVWGKEEGEWKILSWSVERPFSDTRQALVAKVPTAKTAAMPPAPPPDPGVVAATENFFRAWLVAKSEKEAATFFGAESQSCGKRHALVEQLQLLANAAAKGRRSQLSDMILSIDHDHAHLQGLEHPSRSSYLLARMSDELADYFSCESHAATLPQKALQGKPEFAKRQYVTGFRMASASGVGAAAMLLWDDRDGAWKIRAFHLITD